jgi:uncharacterized protein (DUF1778 family)
MTKATDYKNKWQREHKERIVLLADPGDKDRIKAAAELAGESVNAYILEAIKKRMEREEGKK